MSDRVAKKLFVKTYGCQMNVYDSERMTEALGAAGYEPTGRAEDADMVLLNTCHIREKAAEKVYSALGRLKPLRAAKPGLKIAVAGCVAQAEGAEIQRRQPIVDLVLGPQTYHRLPQMMARIEAGETVLDTDFPEEDKFDHLPHRTAPARAPSAFLTVQEGCDKFCAFCVVPYTRGAEVSRPAARILAEARDLVARGVREITLLGQNVNAYHGAGSDSAGSDSAGSDHAASDGGWSLARLVGALEQIEGLARIRYTTSHPNDMGDDLIAAHGASRKLMPYLHLPVQSGSDRILKAMNRRHTVAEYLALVARIRAARPDIVLSGDFIVGFPGETEADFEATMDLVRQIGYGMAYSFRYSSRPGTPAAERPEVDPEVAQARLLRLQALIDVQARALQDAMIGRDLDVLFEKPGRMPGQMTGKSEYLHPVHVIGGAELIGRIARVRITNSESHSLGGEVLDARAA